MKGDIHKALADSEYYRWIDFLDAQVLDKIIKIVAPYEDAVGYIKYNYARLLKELSLIPSKNKYPFLTAVLLMLQKIKKIETKNTEAYSNKNLKQLYMKVI